MLIASHIERFMLWKLKIKVSKCTYEYSKRHKYQQQKFQHDILIQTCVVFQWLGKKRWILILDNT